MDSSNLLDLRGRPVLVTGASSGIGRSTAELLSRQGGKIVLVGRDKDRLNQAVKSCQGEGHIAIDWDLTSYDKLKDLLQKAVEAVGPLHGLVHCAGIQTSRPIQMVTERQLREIAQINVEAAIGLSAAFSGSHLPDGGSIVFMSSVMGLVGQPAQVAYSASKGALIAAARSLALEFARSKVRVNCIAASLVETEMAEKLKKSMLPAQFDKVKAMHPLGLGAAQDVAAAIAYLLSDAARWVTGATLVVDGGYSIH
jgi:NAD(P)-dependent dehydrogenase (short-subunit alcohol dehydrogenase family)